MGRIAEPERKEDLIRMQVRLVKDTARRKFGDETRRHVVRIGRSDALVLVRKVLDRYEETRSRRRKSREDVVEAAASKEASEGTRQRRGWIGGTAVAVAVLA